MRTIAGLDLCAFLVAAALLGAAPLFEPTWRRLDPAVDSRLARFEAGHAPPWEEAHVSPDWTPARGGARLWLAREGWLLCLIGAGAWLSAHALGQACARLSSGRRVAGLVATGALLCAAGTLFVAGVLPWWVTAWLAPSRVLPASLVVGLSAAAPLVLWVVGLALRGSPPTEPGPG